MINSAQTAAFISTLNTSPVSIPSILRSNIAPVHVLLETIENTSTFQSPSLTISNRFAVLVPQPASRLKNSSPTAAFISTSITDPVPIQSILISNTDPDPVLESVIANASTFQSQSFFISNKLAVLVHAPASKFRYSAPTAAFISTFNTQAPDPLPSIDISKIAHVHVFEAVMFRTSVLPSPSCLMSIRSAVLVPAPLSM